MAARIANDYCNDLYAYYRGCLPADISASNAISFFRKFSSFHCLCQDVGIHLSCTVSWVPAGVDKQIRYQYSGVIRNIGTWHIVMAVVCRSSFASGKCVNPAGNAWISPITESFSENWSQHVKSCCFIFSVDLFQNFISEATGKHNPKLFKWASHILSNQWKWF